MVSMMLLWVTRNMMIGTIIMTTIPAAAAPARVTPPLTTWDRA